MADRLRPHPRRPRRGAILIVAMIVVFAIAALVLTLAQAMRVEAALAANASAGRAAQLAARGGEQYVLATLYSATDDQPVELLEPNYWEAVPVGDAYVWIVRPDYGDTDLPLLGLVDESSKLSINQAGYDRLRRLAGMTDELAASVVDWRDEDEEPTESMGAEAQAYMGRAPAYGAKNAPYETVDELLLVRGMTRALLYGEPAAEADAAATGAAPAGTATAAGTTSFSTGFQSDNYRHVGLQEYLTIWNAPSEALPEGVEQRLDVNNAEQRQDVRDLLAETFGDQRGGELAGRLPQGNVVDLFDWAQRLDMTADELAEVEPQLSAGPIAEIAGGRVNVNAAPREVLLTIPELTEQDVDALLAERPARVMDDPYSIAWVMDVLEERSVGMGLRLVGRGAFYSAEVVAASADGRAFRRVRIVVDTGGAEPMIVYRRDVTDRGWPLDPEVLAALRRGEGPPAFSTARR